MATLRERKYKKGKCFEVVYDYYEPNLLRPSEPVRKWKSVQFEGKDAKKGAQKFKAEIEKKKLEGKLIAPSKETLTRFLYRWIDIYGPQKWSPSTYENYKGMLENHVIPVMGGRKLQEITPLDVEQLFKHLAAKRVAVQGSGRQENAPFLKSKTRREIYNVLKTAFDTAVEWKLLEESPVTCAPPPREKSERKAWDKNTMRVALDSIQDPILHLAVHLAFACTLRNGETVGLTWDCVDFEKNKIHVQYTLQRVTKEALDKLQPTSIHYQFPVKIENKKSVLVLKDCKTDESDREINMTEPLKEELLRRKEEIERHRGYYGADYRDYGLVLSYDDGTPIEPGKMQKRFKKWQEETELDMEPIVFHGLRHTSISYKLKVSQGDIKSVQGDSGHASPEMILKVYSHIQEDDRKEMVEAFEDSFYGEEKKRTPDDPFDELLKQARKDPQKLQKVLEALLAHNAQI